MGYCHGPEETKTIYKAEFCVCVSESVFYGMSLLPFIAAFQNPKYCRVGMVLLQICKYVCVSSCLRSTWERGRGLCRVNW